MAIIVRGRLLRTITLQVFTWCESHPYQKRKRCNMTLNKALRSALPSLRQVQPGMPETPRGSFSKSIVAANPRFSSNYEVNRSLFQHAKRHPVRTVLGPLSKPDEAPPQEPPKEKRDEGLVELEALVARIPAGSEEPPIEEVYRLSPVLDRILAIAASWTPPEVEARSDSEVVADLQGRLYGLVDIDDFLIRTIVCRILLVFATDAESPLLLPVSRIFYKLSCDQTNDQFFVDENLDGVLMSLVRMGSPESRVFAAGAIRNVAACAEMREKMSTPAFFELVKESLVTGDVPLKLQLMCALKQLCKSEESAKEVAASGIIGQAIQDDALFSEVMRVLALLPEVGDDQRKVIIGVLERKDIENMKTRRACVRAIGAIIEETLVFGRFILKLIQSSKEPEFLEVLLPVVERIVEDENVRKLFETAKIIVEILKSTEYDRAICMKAYAIVKKFQDPQFDTLKEEYSLLDGITVKQ